MIGTWGGEGEKRVGGKEEPERNCNRKETGLARKQGDWQR